LMIGIDDQVLVWIRLQCILLSKQAGIRLPHYLWLTDMDESPLPYVSGFSKSPTNSFALVPSIFILSHRRRQVKTWILMRWNSSRSHAFRPICWRRGAAVPLRNRRFPAK
jgi:hypothetical protein